MNTLRTMSKSKPAISVELALQLSHVEDMFSGDLLDRYFGKLTSESTFRSERPLNTKYASKIVPNASEINNNIWSNPDRQGSEDDAVEEIVEGKIRRSHLDCKTLDYETRKTLERLAVFEEERTEEETRRKYKTEMEVKRANEQLENVE